MRWAGRPPYTVYRSSSSNGSYKLVGTTSSTSFTNTGLSANTTYYYKVTAANSYGTSGYSRHRFPPRPNPAAVVVESPQPSVCSMMWVLVIPSTFAATYPRWAGPKGVAATWTTGNVWVYTTTDIPAGQTFEFKPLINDAIWSTGSNFTGVGGQTITITPNF